MADHVALVGAQGQAVTYNAAPRTAGSAQATTFDLKAGAATHRIVARRVTTIAAVLLGNTAVPGGAATAPAPTIGQLWPRA